MADSCRPEVGSDDVTLPVHGKGRFGTFAVGHKMPYVAPMLIVTSTGVKEIDVNFARDVKDVTHAKETFVEEICTEARDRNCAV